MKKLLFGLVMSAVASTAFSGVTLEPTSPLEGYEASEITSDEAKSIFRSMRNDFHNGSTCANRAMIWAFETVEERQITSEKYFIHYTSAFNHLFHNEGKHKSGCFYGYCFNGGALSGWDYHVASSFMVDGELKVFDKYFLPSRGPVSPAEWEKVFLKQHEKNLNSGKLNKVIKQIKKNVREYEKKLAKDSISDRSKTKYSKRLAKDKAALRLLAESLQADGTYDLSCKNITNIAEHDLDQHGSWCHVQRTSMYYWNQNDLRTLNNGGSAVIWEGNYTDQGIMNGSQNQATSFGLYSVNYSYKEALDFEKRRKFDENFREED